MAAAGRASGSAARATAEAASRSAWAMRARSRADANRDGDPQRGGSRLRARAQVDRAETPAEDVAQRLDRLPMGSRPLLRIEVLGHGAPVTLDLDLRVRLVDLVPERADVPREPRTGIGPKLRESPSTSFHGASAGPDSSNAATHSWSTTPLRVSTPPTLKSASSSTFDSSNCAVTRPRFRLISIAPDRRSPRLGHGPRTSSLDQVSRPAQAERTFPCPRGSAGLDSRGEGTVLYCIECGCCSGEPGKGWVAVRCDDPTRRSRPAGRRPLLPTVRRRRVRLSARRRRNLRLRLGSHPAASRRAPVAARDAPDAGRTCRSIFLIVLAVATPVFALAKWAGLDGRPWGVVLSAAVVTAARRDLAARRHVAQGGVAVAHALACPLPADPALISAPAITEGRPDTIEDPRLSEGHGEPLQGLGPNRAKNGPAARTYRCPCEPVARNTPASTGWIAAGVVGGTPAVAGLRGLADHCASGSTNLPGESLAQRLRPRTCLTARPDRTTAGLDTNVGHVPPSTSATPYGSR